jgi:hypothetical protein
MQTVALLLSATLRELCVLSMFRVGILFFTERTYPITP